MITRNDFAHALIEELRRLSGIFYPHTTHNARALIAQMQSEHGVNDPAPQAKFNPFNTTWHTEGDGSTVFNRVGVREYPTFAAGVTATARTLLQPNPKYNYAPILSCLRRDAPAGETLKAIGNSAWGTDPVLARKVLEDVKRDYWALANVPIGQ